MSPHAATNILSTRGRFTEALSMSLVVEPSLVDGRESATLHYGETAPIPWRWVRDELRALDASANALLGMTIIDVTLVRKLAPANVGVNPSLTITALAERFAARFHMNAT